MNVYIIVTMAALGIGGGFAGIAWGWREGAREAYASRMWADNHSFLWLDGRPVPIAGPIKLNMAPKSADKVTVNGFARHDMSGTFLVRWHRPLGGEHWFTS